MATAFLGSKPYTSFRTVSSLGTIRGELAEASADELKNALRSLASGVSVITTGYGADRTGFTATSVSSLSVDPPRVLVLVNRSSSSFDAIVRNQTFGINFLAAHHEDVAKRFSGIGGVKGEKRYAQAHWTTLVTGTCVLADALAALDCEVEEIISRHSHGIVIGRVLAAHQTAQSDALLYWHGLYQRATRPTPSNI